MVQAVKVDQVRTQLELQEVREDLEEQEAQEEELVVSCHVTAGGNWCILQELLRSSVQTILSAWKITNSLVTVTILSTWRITRPSLT